MELGIFDDDRQKWVQFDTDTEVLIRHIDKRELLVINAKAERMATKMRDASVVQKITARELGRTAVHGWRKIGQHDHPGLIIKGQPFPYTPDNCDMLMERSVRFSTFVNEAVIDDQMFLEADEAREETKNG